MNIKRKKKPAKFEKIPKYYSIAQEQTKNSLDFVSRKKSLDLAKNRNRRTGAARICNTEKADVKKGEGSSKDCEQKISKK